MGVPWGERERGESAYSHLLGGSAIGRIQCNIGVSPEILDEEKQRGQKQRGQKRWGRNIGLFGGDGLESQSIILDFC